MSIYLPLEDKINIAKNLDFISINKLCGSNKEWNILCNDDFFWRYLVQRDFGNVEIKETWYNTYIYYYRNHLEYRQIIQEIINKLCKYLDLTSLKYINQCQLENIGIINHRLFRTIIIDLVNSMGINWNTINLARSVDLDMLISLINNITRKYNYQYYISKGILSHNKLVFLWFPNESITNRNTI